MQRNFEHTKTSLAYIKKHPELEGALSEITELSNECFSRLKIRKGQAKLDSLVFHLGHACSKDFVACTFLATNEYGDGAFKILRSLYEKAVTASYLIKHPNLVDQFINYRHIQIFKVWNAAKEFGTSEEEWNGIVETGELDVRLINEKHTEHKEKYTTTDKDGNKRATVSWDKANFADMVKKVGGTFLEYYLPAYAIANLSVHATMFSAGLPPEKERRKIEIKHSKMALTASYAILLETINEQNKFFELKLSQRQLDKVAFEVEALKIEMGKE